jgi:hypothetical protein
MLEFRDTRRSICQNFVGGRMRLVGRTTPLDGEWPTRGLAQSKRQTRRKSDGVQSGLPEGFGLRLGLAWSRCYGKDGDRSTRRLLRNVRSIAPGDVRLTIEQQLPGNLSVGGLDDHARDHRHRSPSHPRCCAIAQNARRLGVKRHFPAVSWFGGGSLFVNAKPQCLPLRDSELIKMIILGVFYLQHFAIFLFATCYHNGPTFPDV